MESNTTSQEIVEEHQPHLDDDQVLVYTQSIRKKGITELMTQGTLPASDKDRSLLFGILSDMDRSALTNKRIKSDSESNKNMAGGAALIASLLQSIKVDDAIFTGQVPVGFKAPKIGDDVDLPPVSKTELNQGTSTVTFDDFEKQHFHIPVVKE